MVFCIRRDVEEPNYGTYLVCDRLYWRTKQGQVCWFDRGRFAGVQSTDIGLVVLKSGFLSFRKGA